VRPAVAAILSQMGFAAGLPAPGEEPPHLSLRGLPRAAAALVRKLKRAGLEVRLRDLTSPTGIATIGCTIVDRKASAGVADASGCGTHPDARVALTRALTEAAQTRLAFIQGGREDLPDVLRNVGTSMDQPFAGRSIAFDEIPTREHASINEDVEFMLERMRQSGFEQVVVVDVTRTAVAIPAVRVIVPRAESWTLSVVHTGRAAVGDRVLRQIQEASREHSQGR
jgi:ribosomal protein S12 methylthiotransferase accessory factor